MAISRRGFPRVADAGLRLGGMGGLPVAAASWPDKPNIVLCTADDRGWGDIQTPGK